MTHAIITGASGGIGRAVVQALLRDGFTVTATDLELPRETGAHDCRALDVTDADAVERVVSEAWESQGPVDLLVNAAESTPLIPFSRRIRRSGTASSR